MIRKTQDQTKALESLATDPRLKFLREALETHIADIGKRNEIEMGVNQTFVLKGQCQALRDVIALIEFKEFKDRR
jgi:hypothetical protein